MFMYFKQVRRGTMMRAPPLGALALLGGCGATRDGVRAEDAFIREGLPGVSDGALYLTLKNTGKRPVTLLGGATPVAARVVPMQDHRPNAGAAPPTLTVPPGGKLAFEPGGTLVLDVPVKGY